MLLLFLVASDIYLQLRRLLPPLELPSFVRADTFVDSPAPVRIPSSQARRPRSSASFIRQIDQVPNKPRVVEYSSTPTHPTHMLISHNSNEHDRRQSGEGDSML